MLLCSLVISAIAFASVSEDLPLGTENPTEENPQVCKFSIDTPTGTITSGGETLISHVLLSCEQEDDVTATVTLWIDGEALHNKLATIEKGKKSSKGFYFGSLKDYAGKKYKLTVE